MDETLSALEAASEVNNYDEENGDIASTLRLKERTSIIALEEANHSALAWRTIRWVCSTDALACSAVRKEVLEPNKLADAFRRRFPPSSSSRPDIEKEWTTLWETLVPRVTKGADQDCTRVPKMKDLTWEVVDKIIQGVSCPIASDSQHFQRGHSLTLLELLLLVECALFRSVLVFAKSEAKCGASQEFVSEAHCCGLLQRGHEFQVYNNIYK